jgi:16S rRNA processing protein RimM
MSDRNTSQVQTDAAGSLLPSEPAFLAVGKLRHAHGVHGEILMEVFTDFPERLIPGVVLYLESGRDKLMMTRCRPHKGGLLMSFEGYTTPEAIGQFRNQILYVRASDRPRLPEGEYYQHQLIGLQVTNDAGILLGEVIEILETGASDVLVIRPDKGPEVLIPIVDEFVKDIDLLNARILVHLIPGILNEEG